MARLTALCVAVVAMMAVGTYGGPFTWQSCAPNAHFNVTNAVMVPYPVRPQICLTHAPGRTRTERNYSRHWIPRRNSHWCKQHCNAVLFSFQVVRGKPRCTALASRWEVTAGMVRGTMTLLNLVVCDLIPNCPCPCPAGHYTSSQSLSVPSIAPSVPL